VNVDVDRVLLSHPLDQFVELDRLLGGGEGVGSRKSVFAGGLRRTCGGNG
jgi:hypothetical protein